VIFRLSLLAMTTDDIGIAVDSESRRSLVVLEPW
jgi:hypothetical protein